MAFHIKTFRGKIGDGSQHTLSLHTNNGRIGYRIINFRLFPTEPGQQSVENTVIVWKTEQSTVSASTVVVDFNNSDLLGVASFHESHADSIISRDVVIFDREIFNQDIYITHTDTVGAVPINYYIELEQFILNENENTVATLKDIRSYVDTQ